MNDNKVLFDDLRSQFRTFGEGLQLLNDKIDRVEQKVDKIEQKLDTHIEENQRDFEANHIEHQQLMQMVKVRFLPGVKMAYNQPHPCPLRTKSFQ